MLSRQLDYDFIQSERSLMSVSFLVLTLPLLVIPKLSAMGTHVIPSPLPLSPFDFPLPVLSGTPPLFCRAPSSAESSRTLAFAAPDSAELGTIAVIEAVPGLWLSVTRSSDGSGSNSFRS